MSLNERTALITGAGQGMGLVVARRLAAQGVQVLINDIDSAKAEAATREIVAADGKALAAPFDITKTETVMARVAELEASVGAIDILIKNPDNAAHRDTHQVAFKDMPPEEWDMYIGVNLFGVLNCT
ncbi:MAG: SDR family NAD(P)-dependent oxidoreductase, partial [Pseudomonadales bacterium]